MIATLPKDFTEQDLEDAITGIENKITLDYWACFLGTTVRDDIDLAKVDMNLFRKAMVKIVDYIDSEGEG